MNPWIIYPTASSATQTHPLLLTFLIIFLPLSVSSFPSSLHSILLSLPSFLDSLISLVSGHTSNQTISLCLSMAWNTSTATVAPLSVSSISGEEASRLRRYVQMFLPVISIFVAFVVILLLLLLLSFKKNRNVLSLPRSSEYHHKHRFKPLSSFPADQQIQFPFLQFRLPSFVFVLSLCSSPHPKFTACLTGMGAHKQKYEVQQLVLIFRIEQGKRHEEESENEFSCYLTRAPGNISRSSVIGPTELFIARDEEEEVMHFISLLRCWESSWRSVSS